MKDRRLTLTEAAEELGVHYMTVYRYVRTGRLPAVRVGGGWQVDRADLGILQGSSGGKKVPTAGRQQSRARLQARLIAGDEAGAWAIAEAALASDMTPDDVLLELIGPVMHAIGDGWESGELSVADEHRASAVVTRLISRLSGRFTRRGRKRGSVVLACPQGELHGVPVAIAADLLRWRGYEVVELGADTPGEALAEAAAAEPRLVAVGLACTTEASCRAARAALAVVRRRLPEVPRLVGGAAVAGSKEAHQLHADVFSGRRADDLLRALESLPSRRA